jgi:hypothetical protein
MQKDQWHIWKEVEMPAGASSLSTATGNEVGENALYLIHHRGEHRIPDTFEGKQDLLDWAKAGGHFAP